MFPFLSLFPCRDIPCSFKLIPKISLVSLKYMIMFPCWRFLIKYMYVFFRDSHFKAKIDQKRTTGFQGIWMLWQRSQAACQFQQMLMLVNSNRIHAFSDTLQTTLQNFGWECVACFLIPPYLDCPKSLIFTTDKITLSMT